MDTGRFSEQFPESEILGEPFRKGRRCYCDVVDMGAVLGDVLDVRLAVAVIGGFLIFGALFVPFTEKRQALHDLIAKTHVVYAKVLERRSNTSLERTREG